MSLAKVEKYNCLSISLSPHITREKRYQVLPIYDFPRVEPGDGAIF